jgi:hypothetical protein
LEKYAASRIDLHLVSAHGERWVLADFRHVGYAVIERWVKDNCLPSYVPTWLIKVRLQSLPGSAAKDTRDGWTLKLVPVK